MFQEFKKFAMRGNVVDMAVGIIIGGAFGTIVNSLVEDVLMPPIGLVLGGVDFSDLFLTLKDGTTQSGPYETLAAARAAGAVTLNIGLFLNALVSFLIVAFAAFLLIQAINRLHSQHGKTIPEPNTRKCPYCLSTIPVRASRCAHCTSVLDQESD